METKEYRVDKEQKTYGCDSCIYLKKKYCSLWEIRLKEPYNSHCESHREYNFYYEGNPKEETECIQ